MGGKKKYIEMFGSFTEPFNYLLDNNNKTTTCSMIRLQLSSMKAS